MNSNWSYRPEANNLGKNRWLFVPCGLELCHMTLKIIGYLFYAISSFVHDFIAIGEFKLELQLGNTQPRAKCAPTSVTLTVDLLPFAWTLLLSVAAPPVNFMMIQWEYIFEKCVTDVRTDGLIDRSVKMASGMRKRSKCYTGQLYLSLFNECPTCMTL